MAILTSEVKEFVKAQKLGFCATVCPDGTPNLSPKGTTAVWDDEHLVFADIHSPGTIQNLLANPAIEINMVDVFLRRGYRFKGLATVISEGPVFDKVISFYGDVATKYAIKHVVLVKVERILPVLSPVYDDGASEDEIVNRWREYWKGVYG